MLCRYFAFLKIPEAVRHSCLITLLVVTNGCGKGMKSDEFVSWVRDPQNGLHLEGVHGEYQIEIQYMPASFQRALYGQGEGNLNNSNILNLQLKISSTQGDLINGSQFTQDQTVQREYYYAYRFQNDIYVEYDGQRTACGMLHLEKNVNGKGQRTFHLVFEPVSQVNGDFIISIESNFISTVPLRFKIRNSNIPTVIL